MQLKSGVKKTVTNTPSNVALRVTIINYPYIMKNFKNQNQKKKKE